ncbi:MAG TPA: phytanoyl-CoA dioxygenase family protein [Mycobacteriales bacterium]|nr:phytanoyl-CoA dioxygenase family protein [Mycobacteriales bacterium]
MDITSALAELHAEPLSEPERRQLDADGFLPLPGLIPAELLDPLRDRLAELSAEEGETAGQEVHQEVGTDRLSDLVNKDAIFEICFTQPRVLGAMAHVLEDFTLSSLNARAALPGQGAQSLHADWSGGVKPGEYQVCNSIWLLDDFTAENGATRVVPGSHRSGSTPAEAMEDPTQQHPDEIQLLGEAGTVVIFNSHLWHGGTLNRSDRPRRAMHSYFCRRGLPQQLDQAKYIRPETRERLSPAAQYILGV